MGNHEYCAECGESDFHYGQCNPEAKAKHQAWLAENKRRGVEASKQMCEFLQQKGVIFALDEFDNAVVSKWGFDAGKKS